MTYSADVLPCVVLTVDQRSSRHSPDRVAEAISSLEGIETLLPFVRTAGDEFQGVLLSPAACSQALLLLLRDRGWHIGVGLGTMDLPVPDSSRAGRGSAFLAARTAVESATTRPRVVGAEALPWLAESVESALWLWQGILEARTAKGWDVVDLLDQGHTQQETADRLGIGQPAVTQRASAARLVDGRRAHKLTETLLDLHLTHPDGESHAPSA